MEQKRTKGLGWHKVCMTIWVGELFVVVSHNVISEGGGIGSTPTYMHGGTTDHN